MGNSASGSGNKKRKQKVSKTNKNKNIKKQNNDASHDWILSCIINLIQSTECSMVVDGFIDTHCLIFEPNNSQINNEYTKIHLQYKQLVETLLISKLSKLGITAKQFTEAMQKSNDIKINSDIFQYISAVDDFHIFQNLMTQRNIELEKEAIAYLSQYNPENELNQCNTNPVNISNMTEQEQIAWALQESIAIQKQEQQQIMDSLPNYKQYDIVPSAPFLSREPSHTPTNTPTNDEVNNNNNYQKDNNLFDMVSNINMSEPKRMLLQPLKLKKEENVSFEGMKNDEVLPALSAASIQNIKSKYNESILKRKQMILSMRRQKRNEEFELMKAEAPGWDSDMNKQTKLAPLHKSLVAKVKEGEGSDNISSKEV
eukprot:216770_1